MSNSQKVIGGKNCVLLVLMLVAAMLSACVSRSVVSSAGTFVSAPRESEELAMAIDSLLTLAYRDDAALLDTVSMLERIRAAKASAEERAEAEVTGLLDDMLETNALASLPAAVIRFDFGSGDLSPLAYRQLDVLSRMIGGTDDVSEFFVIGSYDDPSEPLKSRQRLATRRCRKVCEALNHDFGVEARRLRTLPDGGCSEVDVQRGSGMVLVIVRCQETEDVVSRWMDGID
ncbi:MAG: hypothetical protein IJ745_02215 [Bacteroidales bacterium]|nr:hypothetical protein [Bacteroidales bacterium]